MKSALYVFLLMILPACGQTQSGDDNESSPSGESTESTASAESVETSATGGFAALFSSDVTEDELNQKLKNRPLQDQKGMRFLVPDDTRRIGYGTDLLKFSGSSPEKDTYTKETCGQVVGQVFTLDKLVSRTIDDRECTLAVLKKGGAYYATVIREKLAEVTTAPYLWRVPGMVNLSLIEEARKLLVGRNMFSLRHSAHDTDTTNNPFADNNDYIYLQRFVPVTIRKVEPGQADSPFKITIEYLADNLMHVGQFTFGKITPIRDDEPDDDWRFTNYYGFSDHRSDYKDLSKTIWRAVQDGTPVKGMTMKECELALGKPSQKLESFDEKQINEWYYSNKYGKSWNIIFVDGTVDRYLNYER